MFAVGVGLTGISTALVLTTTAEGAQAAGAAPFPSESHYIYHNQLTTTNSSTVDRNNPMYKLGAADGKRIGARCGDFMTVLDFAQPDRSGNGGAYHGYGANLKDTYKDNSGRVHSYFASFDAIRAATFQYAGGWYYSTGNCPTLKLDIGISNYSICQHSRTCDPGTYGQVFGDMLANTVGAVNSYGWQRQVYIWAGYDAEPSYDSAAHTRALLDGFTSNDPYNSRIYDFGSAESGYWSDSDIRYIAYGNLRAYTIPEILNSGTVNNWRRVMDNAGQWPVDGVETDCPQSNHYNPNTAWDAWNGTGYTTYNMTYSTDLGSGAQSRCGA